MSVINNGQMTQNLASEQIDNLELVPIVSDKENNLELVPVVSIKER